MSSHSHPHTKKVQIRDSSVQDPDRPKMPAFKSSFDETKKAKIQVSWKNITIKAPPKAGFCKKVPEDAEPLTILGKKLFLKIFEKLDFDPQFPKKVILSRHG